MYHYSQQNLKIVMLVMDQDKEKHKQIHIWNPMTTVSAFIM